MAHLTLLRVCRNGDGTPFRGLLEGHRSPKSNGDDPTLRHIRTNVNAKSVKMSYTTLASPLGCDVRGAETKLLLPSDKPDEYNFRLMWYSPVPPIDQKAYRLLIVFGGKRSRQEGWPRREILAANESRLDGMAVLGKVFQQTTQFEQVVPASFAGERRVALSQFEQPAAHMRLAAPTRCWFKSAWVTHRS
jgi:hypothetical protein